MNKIQLSQLISTRISHDIIGNVGALSNALELMSDNDLDLWDDIKKVFSASSKVLSARMKFFRITFGTDNAVLSDNDTVFKIITDYLNTLGSMNNVYEFVADNIQHNQGHNKLLLCASMVFADLLIKGGEIKSCYNNDGLWVAANSQVPVSEEKLNIIKRIVMGSEEYNTDAQYAPILYMRELCENKYKITVIGDSQAPVFLFQSL